MNMSKEYIMLTHIKYKINVGEQERALIIPNKNGVPDMKNVLCLSDTSLDIWNMISEKLNRDQIIAEMCKKYNQEKETIERDVKQFLCELLNKGYIVEVE